jgi:hypothetical protein
MNDLTEKMLPITQEKFDKMFASGANTLINGVWGWENLPPTVRRDLSLSLSPGPSFPYSTKPSPGPRQWRIWSLTTSSWAKPPT